jgi:hypothetical protein
MSNAQNNLHTLNKKCHEPLERNQYSLSPPIKISPMNKWWHTEAPLVEALRYMLEGCRFDS